MAVIHRTTVEPSMLELLTSWLPSRPWYRGGTSGPELSRVGGFRLDDPRGEVGIEFMVITDTSGAAPVPYLVPLTYRGAPLDGADGALVGTAQHGVLGQRWAYDGCHDPVLVTQLLALIGGRAEAQAQSVSDTPDTEISRSFAGARVPEGVATTVTDHQGGTDLVMTSGASLRVRRELWADPGGGPRLPEGASGHVGGPWDMPDGTRPRGLFAVLHTEPPA